MITTARLTKADIDIALQRLGNPDHFRRLCFRHPDIRVRAGYQAGFYQQAAGFTGGQLHPPIDLLRATPAGQKIPVDESPLMVTTCRACGGDRCEPIATAGETHWLTEDAE